MSNTVVPNAYYWETARNLAAQKDKNRDGKLSAQEFGGDITIGDRNRDGGIDLLESAATAKVAAGRYGSLEKLQEMYVADGGELGLKIRQEQAYNELRREGEQFYRSANDKYLTEAIYDAKLMDKNGIPGVQVDESLSLIKKHIPLDALKEQEARKRYPIFDRNGDGGRDFIEMAASQKVLAEVYGDNSKAYSNDLDMNPQRVGQHLDKAIAELKAHHNSQSSGGLGGALGNLFGGGNNMLLMMLLMLKR